MAKLINGSRASSCRVWLSATIIFAFVLAACGGGGGGSSTQQVTIPQAPLAAYNPDNGATIVPTAAVTVTVSNVAAGMAGTAKVTCPDTTNPTPVGLSQVAVFVVSGTTAAASIAPTPGGWPTGTCTASNTLTARTSTFSVACGNGLVPDSTGTCVAGSQTTFYVEGQVIGAGPGSSLVSLAYLNFASQREVLVTNATGMPLGRFVLGQTLADGTVLLQAMVLAGSNPVLTVRLNSLTKAVSLYAGTEAFVRVEPLLPPDAQSVTAGGTTCTRPVTSNFVVTCTGAQAGTFGSEALGNVRYIFAITTN